MASSDDLTERLAATGPDVPRRRKLGRDEGTGLALSTAPGYPSSRQSVKNQRSEELAELKLLYRVARRGPQFYGGAVNACAVVVLATSIVPVWPALAGDPAMFTELFPSNGVPSGWVVTRWDDLKTAADPGVVWKVENGVLTGSEPRGTWLVSEKEYSDFELEFEWRLGERGNSGVALRAPMAGDPAFDGLELQMADPRYSPPESPMASAELTGALYRAVAPKVQAYKPESWNRYRITCFGPRVLVVLNGVTILDVNLDEQTTPTKRHDGSNAPPLKDRPRRGHIGFQELSRGGTHVQIRGAKIRELSGKQELNLRRPAR